MNALDILILAAIIGAAVGGFRMGFVARSTSWAGMAVGLVVAAVALPRILERVNLDDQAMLVVAIAVLFAGAFAGQAIGLGMDQAVMRRVEQALAQGQRLGNAGAIPAGIAGGVGVG